MNTVSQRKEAICFLNESLIIVLTYRALNIWNPKYTPTYLIGHEYMYFVQKTQGSFSQHSGQADIASSLPGASLCWTQCDTQEWLSHEANWTLCLLRWTGEGSMLRGDASTPACCLLASSNQLPYPPLLHRAWSMWGEDKGALPPCPPALLLLSSLPEPSGEWLGKELKPEAQPTFLASHFL